MLTSDVVIAGGGIIGLSAALELASAGLSVTVFERGEAMREASWAAAGMLAAHDPENPPALRALAEFSLALYPSFLGRVESLSGVRVPRRTFTTLQGLHAGAQPGRWDERLDAAGLETHAPDLVPGTRSFIRLEEQSIDPRDLCRALPLAVRAAGVRLREHTTVLGVARAVDWLHIEAGDGGYKARHFVDCTGAWVGTSTGAWAGLANGEALPIEPRKGQMLAVTLPAAAPALTCVLRTPALYLVPRGDGRVIVGATVESTGFDRTLTSAARENLLREAGALWPPIRQGVVTEHWSGLRPGTPDGLPIIDSLPEKTAHASCWHVATGHFRNGILLAPGTARILRRMILGEALEVDLQAFRLARFAAVAADS